MFGYRKGDEIYNEFEELEALFNRILGNVMGGRRDLLLAPAETALEPAKMKRELQRAPFTDIQETEKEVIVTSELPGVEKDGIEIDVSEDRIEISAERKHEEEKEEEGYVHRERSYGSFKSAFSLPAAVDPGKAKATYKNGVLEVALPKTKPSKKAKIEVE